MKKEIQIIDAFTFFNAVDVLKMRLQLHDPYVDRFYICESNVTYSGLPKEYILEKHMREFDQWAHKITYIKYAPDVSGLDFSKRDKEQNLRFDSPAWILEFGQRNELKNHIKNFSDDDIIIITDMDEFIDPNIFNCLKAYSAQQDWDEARLHMPYFVYYMNCIWPGKVWTHPFLAKGKRFKKIDNISNHRHLAGIPYWFTDAGWHFNGLGGIESIMEKFIATSHTEYIEAGVNDQNYVLECIKYCMNTHLDKRKACLQNTEFGFLPLSVFPNELRQIMLENPRFVITNLNY